MPKNSAQAYSALTAALNNQSIHKIPLLAIHRSLPLPDGIYPMIAASLCHAAIAIHTRSSISSSPIGGNGSGAINGSRPDSSILVTRYVDFLAPAPSVLNQRRRRPSSRLDHGDSTMSRAFEISPCSRSTGGVSRIKSATFLFKGRTLG